MDSPSKQSPLEHEAGHMGSSLAASLSGPWPWNWSYWIYKIYIYINFKKLLEQNETGFLTAELFRGFHPLMCMDFLRQGAYSMQVYLTSTQTTRWHIYLIHWGTQVKEQWTNNFQILSSLKSPGFCYFVYYYYYYYSQPSILHPRIQANVNLKYSKKII